MASLVLLVAMLGSIVLTINSSSSRRQFLYKQVNIFPKQAVFLSNLKV